MKNTGPIPAHFCAVITAYYSLFVKWAWLKLARFGKNRRLCPGIVRRYGDSMKTPKQLSREAIEEFKAIYQEEFGETLSDDEVQEIAMRLLRFFGILNKE
jgi:hypothetical protein